MVSLVHLANQAYLSQAGRASLLPTWMRALKLKIEKNRARFSMTYEKISKDLLP